MNITLPIEPESNFRLIIHGFKVYLTSLKHVWIMALLFSCIVFLPVLYFPTFNSVAPFWSAKTLIYFILNLISLFIFAAILWRIWNLFLHKHETITEDFRMAAHKIVTIVAAAVFVTILISLLGYIASYCYFYFLQPKLGVLESPSRLMLSLGILIFYFYLNIYIYFLLFFYVPLILTENDGFLTSLRHSATLVWKNWWRVFGVQIIPFFLYVFIISLLPFDLAFTSTPGFMPSKSATIAQLFLFALITPWVAANILVQLRDLELRKKAHE